MSGKMTRTQKVLRRLSPEWQDVSVVCRAKTQKECNQRHSVLYDLTQKGSVEYRSVGKGSLLRGQYRLKTQPKNPCPRPKNPCPWAPKKNVSRTVANATTQLWRMTRAEYRMAETKPKFYEIVAAIKAGLPIVLHTHLRSIKITKPEYIRLSKSGELQIVRGRNWDTLVEQQVDQLAEQAGVTPVPTEDKVYHHAVVEQALSEGKPVPASVLKDYPDLAKKATPPRKNVSRATINRAARLSKRYHGLRPRRLSGVRITWPKALVLIGHVVRLDYLSDKEDGKKRIYTHDFDRPAQVFASGSARGGQKNILLLHGKFAITEEGIVG